MVGWGGLCKLMWIHLPWCGGTWSANAAHTPGLPVCLPTHPACHFLNLLGTQPPRLKAAPSLPPTSPVVQLHTRTVPSWLPVNSCPPDSSISTDVT